MIVKAGETSKILGVHLSKKMYTALRVEVPAGGLLMSRVEPERFSEDRYTTELEWAFYQKLTTYLSKNTRKNWSCRPTVGGFTAHRYKDFVFEDDDDAMMFMLKFNATRIMKGD